MKPKEIAQSFEKYLEEGTTPKGLKVKSFFSNLSDKQKRVVANNVSRAYTEHLNEEKARKDALKKKRKEVNELKKKARELGLKVVE